MHNHLRKLGFFSTIGAATASAANNSNEEDKRVKYLYKNEKHYKIKSKSSNEENSSVKRRHHHHHHHHKHRRHHKSSSSQAELDLLLLAPEETKKHRKKHRKKHENNAEIPGEDEEETRKVHKKRKPEQFNNNTSFDKYFVIEQAEIDETYPRKVRKKRSTSAPVRILDPETKPVKETKKSRHPEQETADTNAKRGRKSSRKHHHHHDAPPESKPEKHKHRKRQKEVRDQSSYTQNFPSIPSLEKKTRSRSCNNSAVKNTNTVSLNVPSTISKITAYLAQHEKYLAKTDGKISITSSDPVSENFSTFENCSKHSCFIDEEFLCTASNNEQKSILKPKSSLVQTSFSIVNIPSVKQTRESIEISSVEKKKKSRSYRKYYDCNTECTSFSDCHKNYDSASVILGDSLSPRFYKKKKLGVELIKPEIIVEEKKALVNNCKSSKIPVYSNKSSSMKSRDLLLHENKKEKMKKSRLNRTKHLPPIKEKSASFQRRVQTKKSAENVTKVRNNSPVLANKSTLVEKVSPKSARQECSSDRPSSAKKSSNKSSTFSSHSDTRIVKQTVKKQQQQEEVKKSKERPLRGSLSNSTFGDKSVDSGRTQTSFLLTKTYKDEEKWKRWQKRKEYADSVRKNLISSRITPSNNKDEKIGHHHHQLNSEQQIVEIRYLTVENCNLHLLDDAAATGDDDKKKKKQNTPRKKNNEEKKKEESGFDHLVHRPEFDALIAPIEDDFHEILNENLSFLKKDFTVTFAKVSYSSLEDANWTESDSCCRRSNAIMSDVSTDDVLTLKEVESMNERKCNNNEDHDGGGISSIISQETVVGDLPVSEESGYSTIKSSSFFQRPHIKALLELPPPLPVEFTLCHHHQQNNSNNNNVVADNVSKFCRDVSTASSLCTIDICSIESKGFQTEMNEMLERSTQNSLIEEEDDEDESDYVMRKMSNLQAVQVIKIDISPSSSVENKRRSGNRVKRDKGYKLWLRKFKYAFRERKQKFSSFTCITTPNNE